MPDQFTVPQFIDAEDKIFGPITARQFVILLAAFLTDAVLYRLLRFVPFLLVGVPLIVVAGVVAFVKINGQPFHYFVLNIIQTFKKPGLRVWDKTMPTAELKALASKKEEEPPPPPERKKPVASSRLQELSLVIDTGGVYQPE